MAYFRGSIRSKTLDMDTTLNVIVPYDKYSPQTGEQLATYDRTLILLHGLRQNADAWPRMSDVEQLAYRYGYCVIMPEVQRSYYSDMALGLPYFTYLTQEVPWAAAQVFRLPLDPAHLYVGGLSMGGYGAMKCALTYPDRYAGVLCFSSGFYMLEDTRQMMENGAFTSQELQGVLGDTLRPGPDNDLDALMDAIPPADRRARVYLACGTEDYLYGANRRMRERLIASGFDVRYEEWPGGHDWDFWSEALARGMASMAQSGGKEVKT